MTACCVYLPGTGTGTGQWPVEERRASAGSAVAPSTTPLRVAVPHLMLGRCS